MSGVEDEDLQSPRPIYYRLERGGRLFLWSPSARRSRTCGCHLNYSYPNWLVWAIARERDWLQEEINQLQFEEERLMREADAAREQNQALLQLGQILENAAQAYRELNQESGGLGTTAQQGERMTGP